MFGTRDRGAVFLLCLVISAGVHWALLRGVRVDLGPRRGGPRRSRLEIPFLPPPPRRVPGTGRSLRLLRFREAGEKTAEAGPAPGAGTPPPEPVSVAGPEGGSGEPEGREPPLGEAVSPFDLDSLDLLLAWPWLGPGPRETADSGQMIGLQRALRLVRERALAAADSETIALDTKYGRFGISPKGLMLGPIVIPLPFAPYRSPERREQEQAHAEIRAQEKAKSMRDEDTEGQRERILEWQRRRRSSREGP